MFLVRDSFTNTGVKIKTIWGNIGFLKTNDFILKIFGWLALFAFIACGAIATSKPSHILSVFFVLSLGLLWSKMIKEVVSNSLDLFGVDEKLRNKISQFSFYLIIATFCLAILEMWI